MGLSPGTGKAAQARLGQHCDQVWTLRLMTADDDSGNRPPPSCRRCHMNYICRPPIQNVFMFTKKTGQCISLNINLFHLSLFFFSLNEYQK